MKMLKKSIFVKYFFAPNSFRIEQRTRLRQLNELLILAMRLSMLSLFATQKYAIL